jgi:threonine aldolase
VADLPGVQVETPDTNIVMIQLADHSLEAGPLADALEARGIRVLAFDPRRLRAIAHLDVDDAGIERAVAGLRAVLAGRLTSGARS